METTESPASKVEGMGMDPEDKNKAVEAKTVCRPPEDYEGLLDLQVHFNSAARPVVIIFFFFLIPLGKKMVQLSARYTCYLRSCKEEWIFF